MKFLKYIILTVVALSYSSCAELDSLAPINSIPTNEAITNLASASAALNGVYSSMQDDSFDKWLSLPQYFSDEADFTGTFPTRLEFGNLNVFPANGTMATVYTSIYRTINNANNIIAIVPGVEDISFTAEAKADFIAQAKFIRAQQYLYLVNLWQEVPLVLTPTSDVGEVLNIAKSDANAIYTQIIQDLTEASTNLLAETGPTGASKQAANALLARAALYQGRWSDALSTAESILGDDFDLTSVAFLEDQIYTLGFTPTDGNVLNFFYGPSDFGGRYSIGPSQTLINSYEPDDTRFASTVDVTSASVPFGLKYPSFDAGISGTATDPIFFIRHAEIVLIAAEAAAELGDFDTASSYLNQVRNRAGLSSVDLDSDNFVDVILQERFLEFAFEGPFRLIDLRRKGVAETILGPIGYDACDSVWPIPQRDVDRNPNLTQNTCCNC